MANKSLIALFDELQPAADRQFYSVGGCCELMNIKPQQLKVLMDECEVRFDHCVDRIPYVTGEDLARLSAKLKELVGAIDEAKAKVAACPNN